MSRIWSWSASAAICVAVLVALLVNDRESVARDEKATSGKHSSGRALPPMPAIKQPVMFNTPEADAILAALQVFPADNPWNEDISKRPLHANSKNMIASVG